MKKNTKKNIIEWSIKLAITALVFGYLIYVLFFSEYSKITKSDWEYLKVLLKINFASSKVLVFLLVLVMTFFNWLVESYKWKRLVDKYEKITLAKAYKAILIGLASGFVIPRWIGEYWGRARVLKPENRKRSFGILVICRLSQISMTMVVGMLGVFVVVSVIGISVKWVLMVYVLASLCLVVFLVFRKKIFKYLFKSKMLSEFLEAIAVYNFKDLLGTFILAFFRYSLFWIQYVLLLYWFGVDGVWYYLFAGVSAIFLMKSIVPTINFVFDIGTRESLAILVFGSLVTNNLLIVAASLSIWILNMLIPSFIGLLLLYRHKILS